MHRYTDEQLDRYLQHIGFVADAGSARQRASDDPLAFLTALQRHHMARVPFESLSLHYSRCRLLSLDPEDLFRKIVEQGRGGYCMEVNTFFASVLRGFGLTLFSAGGRVRGPDGYTGWWVFCFLFFFHFFFIFFIFFHFFISFISLHFLIFSFLYFSYFFKFFIFFIFLFFYLFFFHFFIFSFFLF